MTIESVAYEKLRVYAPRLPQAVLDTWQPPQAMKALLEYEPMATENFRLRISPETSYGVASGEWHDLGEHRSLKLSWVRKAYNKLGSLLHATPAGRQRHNPTKVRNDLETIAKELRDVLSSQVDMSMAQVLEFDCEKCGTRVIRNSKSAATTNSAVCLKPDCAAEYYVVVDDDTFTYQLKATSFNCLQCGKEMVLENRKLVIGLEFECAHCKTPHIIVGNEWKYGAPENDAKGDT